MSFLWLTKPHASHAYRFSLFGVVITLIAAVGGIVSFRYTESALVLCYALENFVEFLSSLVVLWRFYCPDGDDPATLAALAKREMRASVAISFILFLLGIEIIVDAHNDFQRGEQKPEGVDLLLGLSFSSIIVFGFLTGIKFHYADCLESPSLHKDGLCSLIGTTLSLSLFVNTMIVLWDPDAWWLDPAIATIVGCLSMLISVQFFWITAFVDGVPIFSPTWWVYGVGDRMGFQAEQEESRVEAELPKFSPKVSEVV